MKKDLNVELARLLGWKIWQGAWNEPRIVFGYGQSISLNFDTDMNSMVQVWRVLVERGLWEEFYITWCEMGDGDTSIDGFGLFLTDLPGQVKAACKVLTPAP